MFWSVRCFEILPLFFSSPKFEKAEHNKKMTEMTERFFTSIFLKMFFIQGNAIQQKRFGVFVGFCGVLCCWFEFGDFFVLVLFFHGRQKYFQSGNSYEKI